MSTFVYLGVKTCGCGVAVCVDDPKYTKDTADSISEWIRGGLTINRISLESFKQMDFGCECDKQQSLFAEEL